MIIRPNIDLKIHLFKKGITQRDLAFGTEIDEALISKAIKFGVCTEEMREKIKNERNRLIQLMLGDAEKKGKSQKVKREKEKLYHCDTIENE